MFKKLLNKFSTLFLKSAFILLLIFISVETANSQYLLKESREDLSKEYFNLSPLIKDSLRIPKKDSVINFQMKKSPWKSVLYSAVLPGLGQFYNESYWKVPVILTIGGYLGYVIVKNHNKFLDYRDEYAASQTAANPEGDLRLKSYREFYRDQRDQFLLYFAFYYLITLVDSYVDAHLYDFDVSEKVRFSVSPQNSFVKFSISF